jgi:hypothetical protein
VIVRELFARLGLQVDQAGFRNADRALQVLKGTLITFGAGLVAGAAALTGLVSQTARAAKHFDTLSKSLGIDTTTLQKLDYVARQTGTSLDVLANGVRMLSRNAFDSTIGNNMMAYRFKQLGITVKDSNGQFKSTQRLLGEVSDKFAAMPNGVRKAALAAGLFGQGIAGKLLPVLNRGSGGIAAMMEEAEALGLVMDPQMVRNGVELADSVVRLRGALTGLKNAVVGPLLKPFKHLVDEQTEWVLENRKFIKLGVEKVIKTVGSTVKYLLQLFEPLGGAIKFIFGNTTALRIALAGLALLLIGKLGVGVIGVTTAIWGFVRALTVAKAISLLFPILVGGAFLLLLAIIEDVYDTWRGEGETFLNTYGIKLTKWLDDITTPRADDNWLVRWIKEAIQSLTDLHSTIKNSPTLKFLFGAAIGESGGLGDWLYEKMNPNEGSGMTKEQWQAQNRASMSNLFPGRYASPATAAGGTSIGSPNFNLTINAPPGTDTSSLGPLMQERFDAWWEQTLQAADRPIPYR